MPEAGGTAYINDKPKIIGTAVAGECWYAQGRVFDNHVDLLVDTGASLNVIDTETYTKLSRGRDISMKESNTLLRTANGNAMRVAGEVRLELSLAGQTFEIPVIVAELGGLQGILGLRFLSSQGFLIDATEGKLLCGQLEIALHRNRDDLCTVMLSEDVENLPFSEKIVDGEIETDSFRDTKDIATHEPNRSELEQAGLIMPKWLFDTEHDKFTCCLSNLASGASSVRKGLKLETLCSFSEAGNSPQGNEYALSHKAEDDDINEWPSHLTKMVKSAEPFMHQGESDPDELLIPRALFKTLNSDEFTGEEEMQRCREVTVVVSPSMDPCCLEPEDVWEDGGILPTKKKRMCFKYRPLNPRLMDRIGQG